MSLDLALVHADARRIPLADETVQCVVTSPPYWGLRKYKGAQELVWGGDANCEHDYDHRSVTIGRNDCDRNIGGRGTWKEGPVKSVSGSGTCLRCGAWRGAYGLEPTVEMYVAHTVEILREIRRVLRPDGVVFWNIGDSYAGSAQGWGHTKQYAGAKQSTNAGSLNQPERTEGSVGFQRPPNYISSRQPNGLKPKDLCLIPARVALAAQADVSVRNGVKEAWWVRSLIIWAKPNPMPESVTDRPTDAYEHIILLAKSERYFWDQEAVREASVEPERERADQFGGNKGMEVNHSPGSISNGHTKRNLRNVWEFPTQPYSGAHFATFPGEIPRRAILAGTSARGACAKCGAPWRRIVEVTGGDIGHPALIPKRDDLARTCNRVDSGDGTYHVETIGWEPTCKCGTDETVPCLVLDPFGGSGTTGRVAVELNRRAVLLDLAYTADAYAPLARERTTEVQREMFG